MYDEATADRMARRPYARVLVPSEDGGYSARVLEFPGCLSSGATVEEAMANIEEALRLVIDVMLEDDMELPEPIEEREHRETLEMLDRREARAG